MFYVDMHAARYIIDDWFEIDEIENYYVAFFWFEILEYISDSYF